MKRQKKMQPQRTCLGCREKKDKKNLLRIVRAGDGYILPDEKDALPGRGAYLCRDPVCYEKAVKRGAFARAFHAAVSKNQLINLEHCFTNTTEKEQRI